MNAQGRAVLAAIGAVILLYIALRAFGAAAEAFGFAGATARTPLYEYGVLSAGAGIVVAIIGLGALSLGLLMGYNAFKAATGKS